MLHKILSQLPLAQHNRGYFYEIMAHELDSLLQFWQQFTSHPVNHIRDANNIEGCCHSIPDATLVKNFPAAVAEIVNKAKLEDEEVVVRSHSDVSFHQNIQPAYVTILLC